MFSQNYVYACVCVFVSICLCVYVCLINVCANLFAHKLKAE